MSPSVAWVSYTLTAWRRCQRTSRGLPWHCTIAPDFWRDLEQVRADLELAAFAEPFVESNLAMVEAHTAVVDAYITGELVLGRDEVPVRRVPVHDALPKELHAEQWRVVDAIMTSVEQSVSA